MNAPEDMTTAELNSRLDELTTELGRRHDSMLAANGRDDGARISSPIGPALFGVLLVLGSAGTVGVAIGLVLALVRAGWRAGASL